MLARLDDLTGVRNRKGFLEAVQQESRRSNRYRQPFSLAYIDLDNFKFVNDNFGHRTGDEVLESVGNILRTNIRESDTAGRVGGDEFAILLPETNKETVQVLLQDLRAQLLQVMRRKDWPVTFSIGCVTSCQDITVEEMTRRADELMYEVKRGNKDSIGFATTSNIRTQHYQRFVSRSARG